MSKKRKFVKILSLLVVITMVLSLYMATWKTTSITMWKLIGDLGAQGETIIIASEPLIHNTPLVSYILLIGIILILLSGYVKKRKVAYWIIVIGAILIIAEFGILFWDEEIVSFQSKWVIYDDYKLQSNVYPSIGFFILFIGFIIEVYCAILITRI